MDVMALVEPLMPHMETLMSPLSMAKRGKEANDNTLFFLRALAHERLFFCLIPKNGFLALNMVFAIIQKQPFKWNMGDLSCLGDASCKDADGGPLNLTSIFDDESNGEPDKKWRRIVVHRDPVERFLSAYRSKCCLADTDGIQHCDQLFQLNRKRSEITPHAVASRLFSHGYRNGHWMPQRAFCGDLARHGRATRTTCTRTRSRRAFLELCRGASTSARSTWHAPTSPMGREAITFRRDTVAWDTERRSHHPPLRQVRGDAGRTSK